MRKQLLTLANVGMVCFALSTSSLYSDTVGEKLDKSIEKVKDASRNATEKAKDTYRDVKEKAKDTYHDAKESAKDKYNEVKEKLREKLGS